MIPVSNPLTGVEAELSDIADRLKGAVVPVIHDGAEFVERFSTSRIVQEVGQLAAPLDPADEEFIAGLIRSLGAAAARIAALTAPEPDTPVGVDAQPDPA